VAFTAANGDLLVGVVTWDVGAEVGGNRPARLHISWRDSVTFNAGTLITNTGRFIDSRPPGLVVIAIIAVPIALLLPAIFATPEVNVIVGYTPCSIRSGVQILAGNEGNLARYVTLSGVSPFGSRAEAETHLTPA
jgi:hypothetical protein